MKNNYREIVVLNLRNPIPTLARFYHFAKRNKNDWKRKMSPHDFLDIRFILDNANFHGFNGQSTSNLLLGIVYLKGTWQDIQRGKLDKCLLHIIHKNASLFNPQATTNTLSSLVQLRLTWQDIQNEKLNTPLLAAVRHNAAQFNSQNTANTLWSLAQLGATSQHVQEAGLNKPLLEAICQHAQQFKIEEINQIKQAQLWFGLNVSPVIEARFNEVLARISKPKSSMLHLKISAAIKRLSSERLENEYCYAQVLWVDIGFPDKKIAIEIDGPCHATRAHLDAFKENLLTKLGVKVIRINYRDKCDDVYLAKLLQENGIAVKNIMPNKRETFFAAGEKYFF